jgi:hypothetical protein
MTAELDVEQDKDGRWVAAIPDVPGVVGYGLTRQEAVVGLTVSGLHILADRIEGGQLKAEEAEDEPVAIFLPTSAADARLVEILLKLLKGDYTPNAETIAAIEELESGGGESCHSIEELFARLNADD